MGLLRILALSAVALGMAAPQATPPTGYWKLDEPASPVEESIAGADGIWTGAVQASTDVPTAITFPNCGSLRFRTVAAAGGVNGVDLGRSAALDNVQNGSFSISAWVKAASLPPATAGDPDGQYGIVLKQGWHEGLTLDGSGGFVMGHWVPAAVATDPPIYAAAGYGTGAAVAGGALNNWCHVVGVVDVPAGTVRIYVNNAAPAWNAQATFPAGSAALPNYNGGAWRIGYHDTTAGSTVRYQFDGWIDDVRIYNRALTTTEITTLYNGGTLGDPAVTPPAAPTNVQATAGTSQITVTWNPVAGASAYNVKKSTTSGQETQFALVNTNSFTDTGLTPGIRVYYVVTALVGCSESSNSAQASAVPLSPIPPPPRTAKVGGEDNPCGCGTVELGLKAGALALALLLLALFRR